MNDQSVGPFIARKVIQPFHGSVRVMEGKQAQSVWDLDSVIRFARFEIGDAADIQGCTGFSLEMCFERGELGRLISRDVARAQIPAQWLKDCRSTSDH